MHCSVQAGWIHFSPGVSCACPHADLVTLMHGSLAVGQLKRLHEALPYAWILQHPLSPALLIHMCMVPSTSTHFLVFHDVGTHDSIRWQLCEAVLTFSHISMAFLYVSFPGSCRVMSRSSGKERCLCCSIPVNYGRCPSYIVTCWYSANAFPKCLHGLCTYSKSRHSIHVPALISLTAATHDAGVHNPSMHTHARMTARNVTPKGIHRNMSSQT